MGISLATRLTNCPCSNRMDSGRLESLSKVRSPTQDQCKPNSSLQPYAFHQVMRSMFIPLQLATDARNLKLIIDLDTTIDDVSLSPLSLSLYQLSRLRFSMRDAPNTQREAKLPKLSPYDSKMNQAVTKYMVWWLVTKLG